MLSNKKITDKIDVFMVVLLIIDLFVILVLCTIFAFYLNFISIGPYVIKTYYILFFYLALLFFFFFLFVLYEDIFFSLSIIFVPSACIFIYLFYLHYDIFEFDSFSVYSVDFHIKYNFETRFNYIKLIISFFNMQVSGTYEDPIRLSFSELESLLEIQDRALLEAHLFEFIKFYLIE